MFKLLKKKKTVKQCFARTERSLAPRILQCEYFFHRKASCVVQCTGPGALTALGYSLCTSRVETVSILSITWAHGATGFPKEGTQPSKGEHAMLRGRK